jgi:hypothetical protein
LKKRVIIILKDFLRDILRCNNAFKRRCNKIKMELNHATLSYEGRWGTGTTHLPYAQQFIDELPIVVMGVGETVPEVKISANQNNNGQIFMKVPRRTALQRLERVHAAGYQVTLVYNGVNGENTPQLHVSKGLSLIVILE